MKIQGYNVDFLRGSKIQDCWKIHIHIKAFSIDREKFNKISHYIINYLFQEGFITMDIPVKFLILDVLGKPIYVNKYPQSEY